MEEQKDNQSLRSNKNVNLQILVGILLGCIALAVYIGYSNKGKDKADEPDEYAIISFNMDEESRTVKVETESLTHVFKSGNFIINIDPSLKQSKLIVPSERNVREEVKVYVTEKEASNLSKEYADKFDATIRHTR